VVGVLFPTNMGEGKDLVLQVLPCFSFSVQPFF
jgi:hypothetical protein